MTPTLLEEGPLWDVYKLECPKCGERVKFIWRHIFHERDDLASVTNDVYCTCGEIIPTMLPANEDS